MGSKAEILQFPPVGYFVNLSRAHKPGKVMRASARRFSDRRVFRRPFERAIEVGGDDGAIKEPGQQDHGPEISSGVLIPKAPHCVAQGASCTYSVPANVPQELSASAPVVAAVTVAPLSFAATRVAYTSANPFCVAGIANQALPGAIGSA